MRMSVPASTLPLMVELVLGAEDGSRIVTDVVV